MAEKYNGYANRETFLVALNIDNEQASQEYWASQAAMIRENERAALADGSSTEDRTVDTLAALVQEDHEFIAERADLSGVLADLLNASLERVDWRDLAEHLLAE